MARGQCMMSNPEPNGWRIGFIIYPRFNALDLVGPHEVLARLDVQCLIIAKQVGPVLSERGLSVIADVACATCPQLDVLIVPGGPGQSLIMDDDALLDFVRAQAADARFVAGVCTGTLLLAAAGLLRGRRATTHWLAMGELVKYGATAVSERVVWDERFVTGAGVSAGIDLALALASAIANVQTAKRIQLAIEYDPQPPFNSGHPRNAPSDIVEELKSTSRFHQRVAAS